MKTTNNLEITDTLIKDLLKKPVLTCQDIIKITGLTYYSARLLREDVVKNYEGIYKYTEKANIRTDHFLIYYDCKRFNSLYHDLFEVDLKS